MNVVQLHKRNPQAPEAKALFSRMERSLRSAQIDLDKSIRLAKTLAPILNDQSSNERHLKTIESDAPLQEKVLAVIMLGFPSNRPMLPTLKSLLKSETEAMRMASAIAISQMRDGRNNEILCDILVEAHKTEASVEVKKTIRQIIMVLISQRANRSHHQMI